MPQTCAAYNAAIWMTLPGDDDEGDSFGKRLKQALVWSGLLQKDLAQKLGRSQGAVSRWVKDQTEPSIEELRQISQVVGVSLDYLLMVVDEPTRQVGVKIDPAAALPKREHEQLERTVRQKVREIETALRRARVKRRR